MPLCSLFSDLDDTYSFFFNSVPYLKDCDFYKDHNCQYSDENVLISPLFFMGPKASNS